MHCEPKQVSKPISKLGNFALAVPAKAGIHAFVASKFSTDCTAYQRLPARAAGTMDPGFAGKSGGWAVMPAIVAPLLRVARRKAGASESSFRGREGTKPAGLGG